VAVGVLATRDASGNDIQSAESGLPGGAETGRLRVIRVTVWPGIARTGTVRRGADVFVMCHADTPVFLALLRLLPLADTGAAGGIPAPTGATDVDAAVPVALELLLLRLRHGFSSIAKPDRAQPRAGGKCAQESAA